MTNLSNDLDEKSDDELIEIINGKIPSFVSAKSTTTVSDIRTQARIVLHNRQKKREQSTMTVARWILILTGFLTILTAILVLFAVLKK